MLWYWILWIEFNWNLTVRFPQRNWLF